MTDNQLKLWNAIKRFELDEPEVSLNFTDRLARENGWTIEYSLRAIVEYKKFIFLLTISNHPLTPSDQVDQVWHLHLLYTQSYWEDLCENVLKRKIHHGPTKGGDNEKDKFTDWYEKTKALYLETFKAVAPKDIWPTSEIRFSEIEFQRVNVKRNWIIKKLFI
ncbi:glycine-rich domain-containing protein [Flavobacterium sp.]|uniref:glycine-rich domain-containing protein n=1 Tax=Flavobacterium sp. TaxID=239 RepID=UPI0038FD3A9D